MKLIEGCIANDTKSQAKLYELLKGKMLMVCHRYTKDTDTAHEMMQLGFIKLFNNLSKFDDKGSFEGWIKRIMRNTAIDLLRMIERRYESVGSVDNLGRSYMEHIIDEVEEENDQEEVYELALESIEELSPAYQKVFRMYVIEDKQHKDIAEILGISEGSTKSNLFKAKANLKNSVTEKMSRKDLHL